MRIRWFGQSAFLLEGRRHSVMIDPFGPMPPGRPISLDYPPIEDVKADLVLVTHEHFDHNHVEAVAGNPEVIRATAGVQDSPIGEVVGIAAEHDRCAGTDRGTDTIFCFALDGVRICHLGDFGQRTLRDSQREAIGDVDLLFLPCGGGPTVGSEIAIETVELLEPSMVIPMHYRTAAADFLSEPVDPFLDNFGEERIRRFSAPEIELPASGSDEPVVLVPEVPVA